MELPPISREVLCTHGHAMHARQDDEAGFFDQGYFKDTGEYPTYHSIIFVTPFEIRS